MREGAGDEEILAGGGRTEVRRVGNVVHRQTGPWAASVHSFLRHLENVGFSGAPRVVGTGFDENGRETLTFIPGNSPHPGPWSEGAHHALGAMLAELHRAGADFVPPPHATWRQWFGRALGEGPRIFGHCDLGDWNIIAANGQPTAFIDWEQAGPVDRLVELAQMSWLNVHLFDDDLADRLGLASINVRARQLRDVVDGYGLPRQDREKLVDTMVVLALHDAANEAVEAAITPDSTQPVEALWAMAWRSRSASWIERHRAQLKTTLTSYR